MCPQALPFIGAFVSAAGTLYSGISQAQAARAQAAQFERQAQIERDRGLFESQRERERHRRIAGLQRASFLASGVALEGSPVDVVVDSALENQIDIEAIKYGARLREDNYRFSAQTARRNASQSLVGGVIGSLTPLIGAFDAPVNGGGTAPKQSLKTTKLASF